MVTRVGVTIITVMSEKGRPRRRVTTYADVRFDADGWADASKHLPSPFDLMYLKIEGFSKTQVGWWASQTWSGLRFDDGVTVLYWKRKKEDL